MHEVYESIYIFTLLFGIGTSQRECTSTPSWFFDYGAGTSDHNIDSDEMISSPSEIVFASANYNELNVNANGGSITLDDSSDTHASMVVDYARYKSYLPPSSGKGRLYGSFVNASDPEADDIGSIVWRSYRVRIYPTVAYILTAVCLERISYLASPDPSPMTSQVIIASDGTQTFVICNYWTLSSEETMAIGGIDFLDEGNPLLDTNTDQPGQWIAEVLNGTLNLPTSHCTDTPSWFLDYGDDVGDTSFNSSDDEAAVTVNSGFVVGEQEYTRLIVWPNDGFLQLSAGSDNVSLNIGFYNGYYTLGGYDGELYGRVVYQNDPVMTKITAIVWRSYGVTLTPKVAYIMTAVCRRLHDTTDDVPNTYQAVVVSDGSKTFAIYGYESVSSNVTIEVNDQSFISDNLDPVQDSNNCQAGRWVIQVTTGSIKFLTPTCKWTAWSSRKCSVCGGCGNRFRTDKLDDGSKVKEIAQCRAKKCQIGTHSQRMYRRSLRKPQKFVGVARECCWQWRKGSNPRPLGKARPCKSKKIGGFV